MFQTLDVKEWGQNYWQLHTGCLRGKREEEGDEDGVYWDGVIIDGYEIDCEEWDGVIDGYRRLSARPAYHSEASVRSHQSMHDRPLSSDETAVRYMNSDVRVS